jgi:hypothetical protein
MIIGKPEIVPEAGQVVYRVGVESAVGKGSLWYSVPESFRDLVCGRSDAALAALLIPAMAKGEDIHVHGPLSERLLHNLSGRYQVLLKHVMPGLHRVGIVAEEVSQDPVAPARGVATGFSGGIDSYCALADHFFSNVSERFKVTHLLYNNVGSHEPGGEDLFRKRYQRLLPVAERLELPFVMVHSNLNSFYGAMLGFQQTHTPRNASVALLLQGGIGRFLYASTYPYSHAFVGPTYDKAYSDTITLPLLSTETLDAFSVGSEYTRVEKTMIVAELACSYGSLDVCVNENNTTGFTNCASCGKCLRTLATLELGGLLDRYAAAFDLGRYRSRRDDYFADLFGSRNPFMQEIVAFAKERNYTWPLSYRVMRALDLYPLVLLYRRVKNKARRLTGRQG